MRALASLLLDAALLLAFVLIGRRSHDEPLAGAWDTYWPFLVPLLVGWLITAGWQAPTAVLRTGFIVWAVTVGGGVLLRLANGQGAEPSFIVVTALVLAAFLMGWRVLAAIVRRAARPRRA
ncbi:MAG: DUF3054 domain-containing protein [Microbacteriaceae bacterium]